MAFFGKKTSNVLKKSQFKTLLKKIDFQVDSDEFLEIIEQKNYSQLFEIKYNTIDSKAIKILFEAYYYLSKKQYTKSFNSSYFLVEFILRKEYEKTGSDASIIKGHELLKWGKNRDLLSRQYNLHLQAFREVRNKIVHELENSSPEETYLILKIATDLIKDVS